MSAVGDPQKPGKRKGGAGAMLVLYGDGAPGEAMAWMRLDGRTGALVDRGRATPQEPPPATAPARTVLVLSCAEAQLRRIALPARTEAQARAGVAYLFEGALVGEEDIHFALGAVQDSDGHRLAAAISAARLQSWLDACASFGAAPSAVYLDVAVWPTAPDAIEVVPLGARALVCAGRYGGYAIEAALAGALLARWAMQNGVRANRLGVDRRLTGVVQAAPFPGAPDITHADAGDVELELARAAIAAPDYAPDLRQGRFAVRAQGPSRATVWTTAAALAALALCVQAGLEAYNGYRDAQAAEAVLAQAETAFRAANPEVTRIVNLQAQVRALANARTQSGDHPVLKLTQPLLAARKITPDARLDELRHTGPGRAVDVRFSSTTTAPLEAMAAALRAQGLGIVVRDTRAEAGRYVVTLTVEAPR